MCGNFELCVMNADGSAQSRLTTTPWPSRQLRRAGLASMRTAASLVGRLRTTARGWRGGNRSATRQFQRRAQRAELSLALQLLATLELTGVGGSASV